MPIFVLIGALINCIRIGVINNPVKYYVFCFFVLFVVNGFINVLECSEIPVIENLLDQSNTGVTNPNNTGSDYPVSTGSEGSDNDGSVGSDNDSVGSDGDGSVGSDSDGSVGYDSDAPAPVSSDSDVAVDTGTHSPYYPPMDSFPHLIISLPSPTSSISLISPPFSPITPSFGLDYYGGHSIGYTAGYQTGFRAGFHTGFEIGSAYEPLTYHANRNVHQVGLNLGMPNYSIQDIMRVSRRS